jgi:hypothetical protein
MGHIDNMNELLDRQFTEMIRALLEGLGDQLYLLVEDEKK